MPLYFRRRVPISKRAHLNVSKSGVSESVRVGRRVTVNSRGSVRVRLPGGFFYRIGKWK